MIYQLTDEKDVEMRGMWRQTDIQTERHTDAHTDTRTDAHTDRHTATHIIILYLSATP